MFELTMEDFVPQVDDIISVGEFYEKAAGGQIFTKGGWMAPRAHFSADDARHVGVEIGIDWDSAPFDLEQDAQPVVFTSTWAIARRIVSSRREHRHSRSHGPAHVGPGRPPAHTGGRFCRRRRAGSARRPL